MLKIRRARLEDERTVKSIYLSMTGSEASLNDSHLTDLITKGGVIVAERGGQVIGFGGVDLQATEQIKYLYILPEYQQCGTGSEVLRELEKAAWAAGIEEVRLHSSPGAVGFYVRQGYKEVEAADQVGHNHEGIEMIKTRD